MPYEDYLSRPLGEEGTTCPYFEGWAEGGVANCTFGEPVAEEEEARSDEPLLLQEVVNGA
jgi:hypothetical protein